MNGRIYFLKKTKCYHVVILIASLLVMFLVFPKQVHAASFYHSHKDSCYSTVKVNCYHTVSVRSEGSTHHCNTCGVMSACTFYAYWDRCPTTGYEYDRADRIYCNKCGTLVMSAGMTSAGSHEIEQRVLGCNMTTETEIAKVSLSSQTNDWTSQDVLLTAGIQVASGEFIATDTPFSFDGGGSWSAQSGFLATANGNYEVLVKSTTGAVARAGIQIGNIDKEAPAIGDFSCDETKGIRSTTLSVSASDSISGLQENPYSFDGGGTWTAANTMSVSKNGTYQVTVRDRAGNQTTASKSVTTLYVEPPKVESKPVTTPDTGSDNDKSNSVNDQNGSKTETGIQNSELNNTSSSKNKGTSTNQTKVGDKGTTSGKTDSKTNTEAQMSSAEKLEAYLAAQEQTTLERSAKTAIGLLKNPDAKSGIQEVEETENEINTEKETTIEVENQTLSEGANETQIKELQQTKGRVMSSGFMFVLLSSSGVVTLGILIVLVAYLSLNKVTLLQKEEDGNFRKLTKGYLRKNKDKYSVVFTDKNLSFRKNQQVMLVFHPLLKKIYTIHEVTLFWGKNKKTIGVTEKTTFCI